MTAEDIRNEIHGYEEQPTHEAFRRAFERDKESLRSMGIPIEMKPVTFDAFSEHVEGYYIPKESYYLPELDLEPEEVTALRLAAEAIRGGDEAAVSGLMKLSVDSPMSSWSVPKVMWGVDQAAEQPLLVPVYNAVTARKPLTFTYSDARGETSERTVEPYGLLHQKGYWYVVGRDVEKDALRSFRLSRFEGPPETVEGTFEVPEDFDAAAHMTGESFEIGAAEIQTVVIRFPAPLRWWAEQNLSGAPKKIAEDGSAHVELSVANPDALITWVLTLGPGIEVMSPASFRSAVVERMQAFVGAQ